MHNGLIGSRVTSNHDVSLSSAVCMPAQTMTLYFGETIQLVLDVKLD